MKFISGNYYSIFHKVIYTNLTFYIIGYFFQFLFNFLKIPFLTSIFKPEELGIYSIVISVFAYIEVVLFSWINGTIWRFIYEKKYGSFNTILQAFLPTFLLFSFLAAIVVSILSLFFTSYRLLFLLAYISLATSSFNFLFYNYLISKNQIKKWSCIVVLQQSFSFLLLVLLIKYSHLRLQALFLSTIIFNVAILISIGFKSKFSFKRSDEKENLFLNPQVSNYSFLLVLSNICLTILNNGDRFFIDFFKGKEKLGLYAQYYALASVGFFSIIHAFSNILLPSYNKALANGESLEIVHNIIQAYLLIFTPLLLFLIVNSDVITTLILSKEFHGYHSVFDWTVTGIFVFGFSNFFEIKLKFDNKIKWVVYLFFIAAILNLSLNYILLKQNDFSIAALITFYSYLFLTIAFISFNRKLLITMKLKVLLRDLILSSLLFILINLGMKHFVWENKYLLLSISFLLAISFYFFLFKRYYSIIKFCLNSINK